MLDSPETAWAEFVETAAPTGFSAGGTTASSIDLSWNLLTGADRYELWRDDGAGGPLTKIIELGGNVASHPDSGLIGATSYVYQLVAANDAQTLTSVPTATVTAPTLAEPPPAPTNPIVSSVASSCATFDWDAAAGAASYDVYRDDGAGGAIVFLTNVASNTYLDTNLAPAANYRYQVLAKNPGGDSALSTVAGASTTSSESETFPDPLGGWKTRTMGLYSNLVNYYVATGQWGEDYRGNNPDGLWIHDGGGDSNSYIRFTQPYASTLKTFSIDVGSHSASTIVIYDQNLNVLLNVPVSIGSSITDPGTYFKYSVSSANGIGGFDITGGSVEGSVGIDNIEVTR